MKQKLKYYALSLLVATKRCAGGLVVAAAMFCVLPAPAQQITGTAGDPSATITLDGKQIPAPPMKFGGVIKESALDSKHPGKETVRTPGGDLRRLCRVYGQ